MAGLSRIVLDAARPEDERAEALQHLLKDSAAALMPLVADPRLTEALVCRILDDALNGSLAWQADLCLALLVRRGENELHGRAREHLAFILGTYHGADPAACVNAIAAAK